MSLSINKLHQEINDREERKRKVYEQILKLSYKRIVAENKKNNFCCCTFACPKYVYGLPLYNITNCIIYIMEDLRSKGFKVEYLGQNLVYIDWKVNPGYTEPKSLTSSSQSNIKYDDFRDVMDIHKNVLYGNTQPVNNTYKNEMDDLDYLLNNL